jgi:hypothetical protein
MKSFVHKLILSHVPREATTFGGADVSGCAWVRDTEFVYVGFAADGTPLCGRLLAEGARRPDGTVTQGFERRSGHCLDLAGVIGGDPFAAHLRTSDPGVLAVLDRFAERLDADAVDAMLARGVMPTAPAYAFVSRGPRPLGTRIALCIRYPWAPAVLVEAAGEGGAMPDVAPGDDVDVVAMACVETARRRGVSIDPDRARVVFDRLGGADLPGFVMKEMPYLLALLTDLPVPALPKDPDGDFDDGDDWDREEGDGEGMRSAKAMLCTLLLAGSHARATGSTLRRALPGIGEDWVGGLHELADRTGLDGNGIEDDEGDVTATARGILQGVNDMVCAFRDQVVVPALVEADPGSRETLADRPDRNPDDYAGQPWIRGSAEALSGTPEGVAFRLLARDKTLPGFLDVVERWHCRQAEIEAGAIDVAAGVGWAETFAPWKAPNNLLLSCVTSAKALADEGRAMRNCLASYLKRCVTKKCTIVAVRDGEGSVATIELAFVNGQPHVAQISGRSNAPASEPAREASRALVEAIRTGALPVAGGAVAWEDVPVRDPLTYVGHFPTMRDAWAPYLPRGLRDADAAAFVAAGASPPRGKPARTRRAGPGDRPGAGRRDARP